MFTNIIQKLKKEVNTLSVENINYKQELEKLKSKLLHQETELNHYKKDNKNLFTIIQSMKGKKYETNGNQFVFTPSFKPKDTCYFMYENCILEGKIISVSFECIINNNGNKVSEEECFIQSYKKFHTLKTDCIFHNKEDLIKNIFQPFK